MRGRRDEGSAIVEFLGVGLLLTTPLVYLIVTLGALQGATFAVEAAAREAARVYVMADSVPAGQAAAATAAAIALGDFHLEPTQVSIECDGPCLAPGTMLNVTISTRVDLPWVPAFLQEVVPLQVGVQATHFAQVSTLQGQR